MWIFTTDGFFSIVQDKHCKDDEVVVRARARMDIEKLNKKIGGGFEIIETPKADYLYRMIVPKRAMAQYLDSYVANMNYPNFKDTIPLEDDLRHEAYFECWAAMLGFQKAMKDL